VELNRFTDYALRTLMYLGVAGERNCTTQEIAEAYAVSQHHLAKVVQKLTELELVCSSRGRGGGIRLARLPKEICLGETIAQLEGHALVECMSPNLADACTISPSCVLKSALQDAREAFFRSLSRYTLRDLLRPRAELATQLQLAV